MSSRITKFLNKLSSKRITQLLVVFVIVATAVAVFIYWKGGDRTINHLNEQILHRQQVVARAGVRSIENFIDYAGYSLLVLSSNEGMLSENSRQTVMENFIDKWQTTPVAEMVFIDKEGIVQNVANIERSGFEEGVDVSDRDYFRAAIGSSESGFFVGKPLLPRLGSHRGQYVVPISVPMIVDGETEGVLAIGILLSDLTDRYLEPLKFSEETRIYLVENDGIMLHAPYPKFVGLNYFEYLDKNLFSESQEARAKLTGALAGSKEGKIEVVLPNEADDGRLSKFLIAHSAVKYPGGYWTLAVASPEEESLLFFGLFKQNQIIAFSSYLVVILGLSAITILALRIAQKEAYLEGFQDGRASHKTKRGRNK